MDLGFQIHTFRVRLASTPSPPTVVGPEFAVLRKRPTSSSKRLDAVDGSSLQWPPSVRLLYRRSSRPVSLTNLCSSSSSWFVRTFDPTTQQTTPLVSVTQSGCSMTAVNDVVTELAPSTTPVSTQVATGTGRDHGCGLRAMPEGKPR